MACPGKGILGRLGLFGRSRATFTRQPARPPGPHLPARAVHAGGRDLGAAGGRPVDANSQRLAALSLLSARRRRPRARAGSRARPPRDSIALAGRSSVAPGGRARCRAVAAHRHHAALDAHAHLDHRVAERDPRSDERVLFLAVEQHVGAEPAPIPLSDRRVDTTRPVPRASRETRRPLRRTAPSRAPSRARSRRRDSQRWATSASTDRIATRRPSHADNASSSRASEPSGSVNTRQERSSCSHPSGLPAAALGRERRPVGEPREMD